MAKNRDENVGNQSRINSAFAGRIVTAIGEVAARRMASGGSFKIASPQGAAEFFPELLNLDPRLKGVVEGFFLGITDKMEKERGNAPGDPLALAEWAKQMARDWLKEWGVEFPGDDKRAALLPTVIEHLPKLPAAEKLVFEAFVKDLNLANAEDQQLLAGLPSKRLPFDALRGVLGMDDGAAMTRATLMRKMLKPESHAAAKKVADLAKQIEERVLEILDPKSPRRQHFRQHMTDVTASMEDPDFLSLVSRNK